jgi:long-chain acyl-CoA synthetase
MVISNKETRNHGVQKEPAILTTGENLMQEMQFWKNSWDKGLKDLHSSAWEMSYIDFVRRSFTEDREKIALAYFGVEITYAELDRYANRFAGMLIANGFTKGDVVGINLPNIPEYLIAWLGTLRAGCAVSGVSPLLSTDEMAYQLKDSRAKGLVTLDAIFAAQLTIIAGDLPDLTVIVAASIGGFLPAVKRFLGKLLGKIPKGKVTTLPGKTVHRMEDVIRRNTFSDKDPDVTVTPDDIAYIQYTGGTTGLPKGAIISHRNAVAGIAMMQSWLQWVRGGSIALSGFPFFHIAGLFFNENAIFLGWMQVLIPNPRDTDHICAEIGRYRPHVLVNVPSLYQILIDNPKFKTLDHSRMNVCISSASPFPEDSQRVLEEVVGQGKLLEVYGMTETSGLTVMNPSKGKKKLGSIGLPILNVDIKLLEPGTGREVGVGEPGEICLKGPFVMMGYLNKPEETAKTVVDGYMHTGDVAVMDDEGYLRIVDRTKDMIIVSGFKVFSKRVEEVLAEHPAIDMIAIIGAKNPERPGSELVRACITLRTNYTFDGDTDALKEDILKFAKERLAAYEVPKEIEIIREMPLTSVGKVDKKKLRVPPAVV